MSPALSVVVPCYNEAASLAGLLEAFADAGAGADFELVLVDNGSADGTPAELGRLLPRYPFARALRCPENLGYGGGILKGLEAARGEALAWTHADLQFHPSAVFEAWRLFREAGGGRTLVKGLRDGRPLTDRLFTAGMALFETLYLGLPLRDINGQPVVFGRELAALWRRPPGDFSLDLYALATAAAAGFRVIRFPVENRRRERGASSWNRGLLSRLRLACRTVRASAAIRRELRG